MAGLKKYRKAMRFQLISRAAAFAATASSGVGHISQLGRPHCCPPLIQADAGLAGPEYCANQQAPGWANWERSAGRGGFDSTVAASCRWDRFYSNDESQRLARCGTFVRCRTNGRKSGTPKANESTRCAPGCDQGFFWRKPAYVPRRGRREAVDA
jgi:hypothetical protein